MLLLLAFVAGCNLVPTPNDNGTTPDDPPVDDIYYSVSFMLDDNELFDTVEVIEKERVALPVPEKDGHEFKGWFYDDTSYFYALENQTQIFSDVTVYAHFVPKQYTLTFNRMDGEFMAPQQIEHGEVLEFLMSPRRLGYLFDGWYKDTQFNQPITVGESIESNLTLYAKWIVDARFNDDVLWYEDAITRMIERVKPSIVNILTSDEDGIPLSTGSGVIYRKEGNTYYVVTNHHVLSGHDSIEILYERYGMLFEITSDKIEFVGSNGFSDVGVIKFTSTESFYTVTFGDSYELRQGQTVFAIGNPLGATFTNSVSQGVISGLTRFLGESYNLGEFNASAIQHDAAINPGNSGGALFNTLGEFIGMNTFRIDRTQSGRQTEGLGFAVASNTIIRVIRDLEEFGEFIRPFFGISSNPIVAACGQDYGVCIIEVIEESSAEILGLQANDIIIGFRNDEMDDYLDIYNFDQLREAILNSRVGQAVQVRYIRGGQVFETDFADLIQAP